MSATPTRHGVWVVGSAAAVTAAACASGIVLTLVARGDAVVLAGGLLGVTAFASGLFWAWLRAPIASLGNVVDVATSAGANLPARRHLGARLSAVTAAVDSLLWRLQMADREAEQQSRTLRETTAGVRELVNVLVHTEEVVRAQLSADIHDTVAQSLAHARRLLGAADGSVPEDVANAVEDAEEQVRGVLSRTAPVALENGDLAGAVRTLGDDAMQRYGLTLHISSWPAADHAMPVSLATVVFRFVQEALMNVVKHANTDDAYVSLDVEGRDLVASVADDGGGFDPSLVRSSGGRHVGLHLLGERARLMGGSLQISSAPGERTELRLRLPLPERRAATRPDVKGPEVLRLRAQSSA